LADFPRKNPASGGAGEQKLIIYCTESTHTHRLFAARCEPSFRSALRRCSSLFDPVTLWRTALVSADTFCATILLRGLRKTRRGKHKMPAFEYRDPALEIEKLAIEAGVVPSAVQELIALLPSTPEMRKGPPFPGCLFCRLEQPRQCGYAARSGSDVLKFPVN
jgi:hypothetical protein